MSRTNGNYVAGGAHIVKLLVHSPRKNKDLEEHGLVRRSFGQKENPSAPGHFPTVWTWVA